MDRRAEAGVIDPSRAELACATWLTERSLLLVGDGASSESGRKVAAKLVTNQGSQELVVRELQGHDGRERPRLVLVIVSSEELYCAEGAVLRLDSGRASARLTGEMSARSPLVRTSLPVNRWRRSTQRLAVRSSPFSRRR